VFVPKARRETIIEAEKREKELKLKDAKVLVELEQKKAKTRNLVAESIRKMEDEVVDVTDTGSDAGLPGECGIM